MFLRNIIAACFLRGQGREGQNVRFCQQFRRNCFGSYKDGDERRGRRSHFFGRKNRPDVERLISGPSIDGHLDHIMEEMMAFEQQAKSADDVALLGGEYRGTEG